MMRLTFLAPALLLLLGGCNRVDDTISNEALAQSEIETRVEESSLSLEEAADAAMQAELEELGPER